MTRNGSNEAFSSSTFSIGPDFPIRNTQSSRAHNCQAYCTVMLTVLYTTVLHSAILSVFPPPRHVVLPVLPDVDAEFLLHVKVAGTPDADRRALFPPIIL